MSEGRQICTYCRTELDGDAAVCDACGMPVSALTAPALKPAPEPPPIPQPSALTGPALKPPPEPPAVTAPTLRPPPEPPPPDPNAGPSVGSGNPLLSGRLPAVPAGPGMAAGDPLAGSEPVLARPPVVPSPVPPEPAAPVVPPGEEAYTEVAPPVVPPGEEAYVEVAPPAEQAPEEEAPEPDAHPSDETPPGYVTAASLWKISSPRPDWNTGQAPADVAAQPPDAVPRETGSTAQPAAQADRPPGYVETRHAFPALPPQHTPEEPKKERVEPANPNRSRLDGKTAGIVAAIVLLAALVTTAAVILTGGDEPKAAATPVAQVDTPEPTPAKTPKPKATAAPIDAQVKTLDQLVRFSAKGRQSAVNGDMKAAIANRSALLKDIRALDKQADDKQLKAALSSFDAAIAESLRQNRECASKCSAADLQKVGKLKTAALAKINPILKEHGGRTYKREEI